jgi:hypothetical protein
MPAASVRGGRTVAIALRWVISRAPMRAPSPGRTAAPPGFQGRPGRSGCGRHGRGRRNRGFQRCEQGSVNPFPARPPGRPHSHPAWGDVPGSSVRHDAGMADVTPGLESTPAQRWLTLLTFVFAGAAIVILVVVAGPKSPAMLAVDLAAALVGLAAAYVFLSGGVGKCPNVGTPAATSSPTCPNGTSSHRPKGRRASPHMYAPMAYGWKEF